MNAPKIEGHFVLFKSGTLHVYCCENKTVCGRPVGEAEIIPIATAEGVVFKRVCKKCDEIVG